MTPEVTQLINEIAKQGVNLLPYAKYVAFAVAAFYTFVGVLFVLITLTVLYQFWKINSKF